MAINPNYIGRASQNPYATVLQTYRYVIVRLGGRIYGASTDDVGEPGFNIRADPNDGR